MIDFDTNNSNVTKDLSYFMVEKKDEIVHFKGPDSFKDKDGNVIIFEARLLSIDEIQNFNKECSRKNFIKDKNGKVVFKNGLPLYEEKIDGMMAAGLLISESLIYPNLKDEKIMKFYNCYDAIEISRKVFKTASDFNYVLEQVQRINGLDKDENLELDDKIEEAKN